MTRNLLPAIAAAIAVTAAGAGFATTSTAGQYVKQHGSEKAGLLFWSPSRSALSLPSKRTSRKLPAIQKRRLIAPQYRPAKESRAIAPQHRRFEKNGLIGPMFKPAEDSGE